MLKIDMKTINESVSKLLDVCDSLSETETKIKYAKQMTGEVAQEYFDKEVKDIFSPFEHEGYGIKAHIALDYSNKALQQVQKASDIAETLLDILSKVAGNT